MSEEQNEMTIVCPANHSVFEEKYIYWIDGVVLCSVGIPGLILNIMGIVIILRHPSMHNVFNYLLIGLFFYDSTYVLITMLNQSFMKQFDLVPRFYYLIYPQLMHPLKQISFTASIFMTTLLAYERNLAIADPIRHRIAMDSKRKRRIKLLKYFLIVNVTSFLFNVPKFMEAEINWDKFNRWNETENMHWMDYILPTEMRVNQHYSFYYMGIAKILTMGIFPLISLVYLNWKIYKGVKSPAALFEEHDKRQQKKENELARVLIGIVVLFIICHTFRVAIEIDNMTGSEVLEECYQRGLPTFTLWSIIVDPLSEFMMVFNSAANMVVYCCLNANFRKLIFPCIKKSQETFTHLRTVTTRTRSNTTQSTLTHIAMEDMKL